MKTLDMDDARNDDVNPDLSSKRKYENIKFHGHNNCESDSSKEKSKRFENQTFGVDQNSRRSSSSDTISVLTDGDCNDNSVNDDAVDNDPQYEIFLHSLKVDGNSYVLQINEKNGLSKPLKYDVDEDSDDEPDRDTQKKMKNIIGENIGDDRFNFSSGSKLEAPKIFSTLSEDQRRQLVVENDMRFEPVNSTPFEDQGCLVEELGNGGTYAYDGMCKTNMQGKKCKSRILRKSSKILEVGKSKATINLKKKKDDECDNDYKTFCNNLSYDGNNLVLEYKNTSPIVYETDEYLQNFQTNNSRNSVEENTQLPTHVGGSNNSAIGDDNCHYLDNPSRESHPSFREKLMRILRKPYNLKEHQMRLQDILVRKPIERHMDQRFGREQSSIMNKDGKSYLDHYHDLKKKLQAAKSGHEELNLLRGFFFWLQNQTQEGAFKPWQDASCQDLQPQAC